MTRREILKYSAGFAGATLTTSFISAFLSGCATSPDSDYTTQFFNKEEFQFLRDCLDTLLPATDSPSATAVGVDQQLDHMLANVFNPSQKEEAKASFDAMRSFVTGQSSLADAFDQLESGEAPEEVRQAYRGWKGQSMAYYLSSEIIGEQFLNYLPVPGAYVACLPVAEVNNKKWAE